MKHTSETVNVYVKPTNLQLCFLKNFLIVGIVDWFLNKDFLGVLIGFSSTCCQVRESFVVQWRFSFEMSREGRIQSSGNSFPFSFPSFFLFVSVCQVASSGALTIQFTQKGLKLVSQFSESKFYFSLRLTILLRMTVVTNFIQLNPIKSYDHCDFESIGQQRSSMIMGFI